SPPTEKQNPPSSPPTEKQNPPSSPPTEKQNPPSSPPTEKQNPPSSCAIMPPEYYKNNGFVVGTKLLVGFKILAGRVLNEM
ncbi:MAG: hypothetical protein RIB93_04160, partial [Coleofasciculus sp. D1-CHI-01]